MAAIPTTGSMTPENQYTPFHCVARAMAAAVNRNDWLVI